MSAKLGAGGRHGSAGQRQQKGRLRAGIVGGALPVAVGMQTA
ncbi:hypothetical protein QF035_010580 [Streptomyces umbrinus]|uniref:Uncharacterized protein n=1 Tax=Streptomyces umbrinus TaxID=67370 RepID=A0ABU0TAZ9_9ACTN|nr:hypothetical protein [Streptomyces umbrinus]MDQ1032998.1 hypothetical protein [Streptomyces umbrinus]